jgi:hypothetical protein
MSRMQRRSVQLGGSQLLCLRGQTLERDRPDFPVAKQVSLLQYAHRMQGWCVQLGGNQLLRLQGADPGGGNQEAAGCLQT